MVQESFATPEKQKVEQDKLNKDEQLKEKKRNSKKLEAFTTVNDKGESEDEALTKITKSNCRRSESYR